MTDAAPPFDPLISLAEIGEIEIFVRKRTRQITLGDHATVFRGSGFDFVGIRDWEPGDRLSSVDWAQSSLTNFSPLVTREFEQDGTATVLAVADASLSTRCGMRGAVAGVTIARAVATLGLSATLFQDLFGLVAFDEAFRTLASAPPRIGRPHVLYCLDLYQQPRRTGPPGPAHDLSEAVLAHLRRTALVPVVSDFLFPAAPDVLHELTRLAAVHDVIVMVADARPAYAWPATMSDSWIQAFDVESGSTRTLSRRELMRLGERVEAWQADVVRRARTEGLDAVLIGPDRWDMETALTAFVAERRLRRV